MTKLKDKFRPMLPRGLATFLPEAAYEKRRIEETVMAILSSWGYREVIPPIFEYLDVITRGMGEDLTEKGYKFVDRGTGRLMLLRPDVTPQIARMAAMLMSDIPKPLRLCYRANVFRHEEEHAGRAREIYQMGGELIGLEGAEGDAEVISIAIRSVEALGIKDFKISLGQAGFFNGLIEAMDFPAGLQKQIQAAVSRRDRTHLNEAMKEWAVPVHKARRFSKILTLFGQDEVIEKALILFDTPRCRTALRRLKEVYAILEAGGWGKRLVVDLAEVQGSDYYTGIRFEIFSEQVGVSLGRGGRYDTLVGKFGEGSPATGFAFNMERLQEAMEASGRTRAENAGEVLLLGPNRELVRLFKLGAELRKKGFNVIQQTNGPELTEAILRAKSGGIQNALVLLGAEKGLLINIKSGKRQNGKLKTLLSKLISRGKK